MTIPQPQLQDLPNSAPETRDTATDLHTPPRHKHPTFTGTGPRRTTLAALRPICHDPSYFTIRANQATLDVTQSVLAARLNISPSALSRRLKTLRRDNIAARTATLRIDLDVLDTRLEARVVMLPTDKSRDFHDTVRRRLDATPSVDDTGSLQYRTPDDQPVTLSDAARVAGLSSRGTAQHHMRRHDHPIPPPTPPPEHHTRRDHPSDFAALCQIAASAAQRLNQLVVDHAYSTAETDCLIELLRVASTAIASHTPTNPDRSRVLAAWGCASAEKPFRCGMMRVSRHVSDPLEGASPRWTVAALVM